MYLYGNIHIKYFIFDLKIKSSNEHSDFYVLK